MSISTRIPTGPVGGLDWCYAPLYDNSGLSIDSTLPASNSTPPPFYTCGKRIPPKEGSAVKSSDFQAFCCDGEIIGHHKDTYPYVKDEFNFEDLTCCRSPSVRKEYGESDMTCDAEASATPLASLAGTGTAEAQLYDVTWASGEGPATKRVTLQDGRMMTEWVQRATPNCFWLNTMQEVSMTSVEVAKAQVTTLPPTTTNSLFAESTGEGNSGSDKTSGTAAPTESGTKGAGSMSSVVRAPKMICMGLLLVSWMLSM